MLPGQRKGVKRNYGPTGNDDSEFLVEVISANSISNETKVEILNRAVSDCPKVNLKFLGLAMPSLLDSGSQVTFIRQSYFDQYIKPLITSFKGEKALAHQIFHLKGAGEATLPVMKYVELDIDLLGIVVPQVGVLIVEDPNEFIHQQKK